MVESIFRCLHCVDNKTRPMNPGEVGYDKFGLVSWLIQGFVDCSQSLFNAKKYVTAMRLSLPTKDTTVVIVNTTLCS